MHEVIVEESTDSLWCSYLIDQNMILLNIPVYGVKLFDLNMHLLKEIKPSTINEYFLDINLWPDYKNNWLIGTEIDLSEEKVAFNLEKVPNVYKGHKEDGGFTQCLIKATFDFNKEEITSQIDKKNYILL